MKLFENCEGVTHFLGQQQNFNTPDIQKTLQSILSLSILSINAQVIYKFFKERKLSIFILIIALTGILLFNHFVLDHVFINIRPENFCRKEEGLPDTNALDASLLISQIIWSNQTNLKMNFRKTKIFVWISQLVLFLYLSQQQEIYYMSQIIGALIISTVQLLLIQQLVRKSFGEKGKNRSHIWGFLKNDIFLNENFNQSSQVNQIDVQTVKGSTIFHNYKDKEEIRQNLIVV